MKPTSLLLTAGLTAVAALTQPLTAFAQENVLEEVVVTAQKREQRLIDVPMSVTAISGSDLEQKGVSSIQDLSFTVPGLTMREDGPGSYTIFLRGLANQSGNGALVGVYLDEAPLTLDGYNQLSPVALDLQRVEVLKGPQGTLYGLGSAGGTIRYITNTPKLDALEGRLAGSFYDVSHGAVGEQVEGMINVPIVDNVLGMRLAVGYDHGGGWIDQPQAGIKDGNGTKLLNARGKLLWKPSENFSGELMLQVHRADTRLGLGYEEADRTVAVGPDRAKVLIPKKFNFNLYNLTLDYGFSFAHLVSTTTYIDHDHQYPFTYIPRPGNFSYGYVEGDDDRFVTASQFSQEVRLASTGEAFEWTLGAFYRNSRSQLIANYEYLYAPNGDLYAGGGTLYSGLYYRDKGTSESDSFFADASYTFADRWTIGAGARSFHDKQNDLIEYAPGTGTPQSGSFNSVDPRAYVTYKYSDHGNVYLSFGKGFRSGGFNSAPFGPYSPEKILTYELGTKAAFADGRFQLDAAAYYTNYEDMVRRRLVFVSGAYLSESSNIGTVEVKGFEFGLAWKPASWMTLSATGAYNHSEITNTDAADAVNVPGDRTDYTPRVSYTVGADFGFHWSTTLPGYVRFDFNHRDAVTYIDRSSFVPAVLPQASDELNLLNARLGANFKTVDVELFILNATDENKSIDPYQGWANANRTQPRSVGLRADFRF